MKILFGIHNFHDQEIFLQPRHFIYNVSKVLVKNGHEIMVVTDGSSGVIENIKIIGVDSLHDSRELLKVLHRSDPDAVIWSISPLNVLTGFHVFYKKIEFPLIGNFSYPFYSLSEILRAQSALSLKWTYKYYLNSLVNKKILSRFLNQGCFSLILCQSRRNIFRLRGIGVNERKLIHLKPGIDEEIRYIQDNNSGNADFTFLYSGPARTIRGIKILLKAFQRLYDRNKHYRLLMLTRDTHRNELNKVRGICQKMKISEGVKIIEGWLNPREFIKQIESCKTIVLPFVLVPSDMAVTAIEALALGKPVIATDLDGMPEIVEDRGILIKHNNVESLTLAMEKVANDRDFFNELRIKAVNYMETYPTWEQIADKFIGYIENIK